MFTSRARGSSAEAPVSPSVDGSANRRTPPPLFPNKGGVRLLVRASARKSCTGIRRLTDTCATRFTNSPFGTYDGEDDTAK